jgi:hypothetical protein
MAVMGFLFVGMIILGIFVTDKNVKLTCEHPDNTISSSIILMINKPASVT